MRRLATALVLIGMAVLLGAIPGGAQDEGRPAGVAPIDVVQVSGLLDPVVVELVDRALDSAVEDGVQALVLQLNSRGAVVSDARVAELAARIEAAPVPVGIWVGPSGSRALGASGQLLAAADHTGMAPESRLGDLGPALPGRPVLGGPLAEQLVDGTVSGTEAAERGVIDTDSAILGEFVVSLDGLELDGRTLRTAEIVETASGPGRQPIAQVRFSKLGVGSQLFHTVASPPVAYLLLLIGLALLVFEFFTAGIGIAGVVGAVCLVLSAYGLDVLPTRWWALGLLVLSVLGFAVDVQTGVPRFWTGVGIAALIVGSFFLYDGLGLSWITLVVGIGGMLLAMLSGMPAIVRTRFATPTIGREWMIGETGEAVAQVAPEGLVRVRDALWPARTNRATPIAVGDAVRVVAIDGVVLEVEPEVGAARDYRERRGS